MLDVIPELRAGIGIPLAALPVVRTRARALGFRRMPCQCSLHTEISHRAVASGYAESWTHAAPPASGSTSIWVAGPPDRPGPCMGCQCLPPPTCKEKKMLICVHGVGSSMQCYRTTEQHPTFQSLSSDDFDKKYCDLDPHTCTREDLRDFTTKAVEMGVGYLGVCCGMWHAVPCSFHFTSARGCYRLSWGCACCTEC